MRILENTKKIPDGSVKSPKGFMKISEGSMKIDIFQRKGHSEAEVTPGSQCRGS